MHLWFLLAALVAAWPTRAQTVAAEMDAYIETHVKARRFMGSVLVANDGEVILRKGYGMANLELDVPNKPETKFRLGSITKQFVATAILQLEEKGKLSVRDPLCKFVPDCPAAWKNITIHHMLTHTSGIPNFTSDPDYPKTWMLTSRPEQTMKRFKDKPLDFQPGEKWSYSNSAYVALGYVLEKASGEKYEDYMRKYIFDVAGMADSGHDTHDEILKNRATGYSRGPAGKWLNSAYHDMTIPIGGGDLYSTVDDLYKWDQALSTEKLLSRKSIDRMYTPALNRYGYGWIVDRQYGRARYTHGGGINGFATSLARFPEQRAFVAVLGNMDFANSGEIANNLSRILFGEKLIRPEDRKAISLDVSKLDDYVGQYEMPPGARALVSVEDGKLMVMLPGTPRVEVFPEAPDRFFYKQTDRVLAFERAAGGRVSGMVIHRAGTETEAKRISAELPPPPKEIAATAADLAGLPGEYVLTPNFSIVVTVENGKAYAQGTGQPRFEMFYEGEDKFFLKVVEAKFQFKRGPDGKAVEATLHQAGRQVVLKRK